MKKLNFLVKELEDSFSKVPNHDVLKSRDANGLFLFYIGIVFLVFSLGVGLNQFFIHSMLPSYINGRAELVFTGIVLILIFAMECYYRWSNKEWLFTKINVKKTNLDDFLDEKLQEFFKEHKFSIERLYYFYLAINKRKFSKLRFNLNKYVGFQFFLSSLGVYLGFSGIFLTQQLHIEALRNDEIIPWLASNTFKFIFYYLVLFTLTWVFSESVKLHAGYLRQRAIIDSIERHL